MFPKFQLPPRALGVAGVAATFLAGAAFAVPGAAQAAAQPTIFGSGSTLQNSIQQQTWTADYATDGLGTVNYNTDSLGNLLGGTGSGAGLTEFALQGSSPAITPASSSNGSFLDAFIGTDDPPSPGAMSAAATAADSNPEPVPVVDAPVAFVLHLPSGCTISGSTVPVFLNHDINEAFQDNISWNVLLTDAVTAAGGGDTVSGCSTTAGPIIQVRSDGSGTSFAFKQYLSQIDSTTWSSHVNDNVDWPAAVQTQWDNNGTETNDQGSGGEAAAVAGTAGSIGYVNTADAASHGFAAYSSTNGTTFWADVQNNGTATTGTITGAEPTHLVTRGNCPTSIGATLPSGTTSEPDWTGVHAANPTTSGAYPLCTLTYDVAWKTYNGSTVLNPDYTAKYSGETATGVGAAASAYFGWLVSTASGEGQSSTVIPSFYSALPGTVQTVASQLVTSEIDQN